MLKRLWQRQRRRPRLCAERAQKRRLMIIAAAAVAFVYVVSRQISKRQKKNAVRMARLRRRARGVLPHKGGSSG